MIYPLYSQLSFVLIYNIFVVVVEMMKSKKIYM